MKNEGRLWIGWKRKGWKQKYKVGVKGLYGVVGIGLGLNYWRYEIEKYILFNFIGVVRNWM